MAAASPPGFGEHKLTFPADHQALHDMKIREDMVRLERAQWLRAAILGANDGLLSTTSLMLGVAAAKESKSAVMLSGLAGALAGACSMAVGEFVSVSTQRDIELKAIRSMTSSTTVGEKISSNHIISSPSSGATTPVHPVLSPVMKKIEENSSIPNKDHKNEFLSRTLPNRVKASAASAMSFLFGSCVPLFSAFFVSSDTYRAVVVAVVTSLALALFGAVGARLGGSPMRISALRVLIGGWIAMGITYGLLKPFDDDDDKGKANY